MPQASRKTRSSVPSSPIPDSSKLPDSQPPGNRRRPLLRHKARDGRGLT
jgi:hypothetical protein